MLCVLYTWLNINNYGWIQISFADFTNSNILLILILTTIILYVPIKVNNLHPPPCPQHMTWGLSDHTGDSTNNSFRHHSDFTNGKNIYLLGGNSDNES